MVICSFLLVSATAISTLASETQTTQGSLTPVHFEIEKQRNRLSSIEVEERRDAVARLGLMHHPDASRAALPALNDPMAIVRVTASTSLMALPPEERALSLLPLLADKEEFVRQEVAYALGKTRSQTAVSPLIERLLTDKKDGVRGAAAVALGEIGQSAAAPSLAYVLYPEFEDRAAATKSKKVKKSKKEQNRFVLRAAAHSLGQIGSSTALPALIGRLRDENAEDDVRRESAVALGLIGDQSALPALREALTARDPYLALAAQEAIRRILQLPGRVGG